MGQRKMEKSYIHAQDICQDESLWAGSGFRLSPRLVKSGQMERVSVSVNGRSLHLEAWGAVAAASQSYALSVAARGSTLPELLGKQEACYSERWLLAESRDCQKIAEGLGFFLPTSLTQEGEWAPYARRVAELGFSGVIFSPLCEITDSELQEASDLADKLAIFEEHGLRVCVQILHVKKACPLSSEWQKIVCDGLALLPPSVDVFWQSTWQNREFAHPELAREATVLDLLSAELKGVEAALGSRRLIYYMPSPDEESLCKQQHCFDALCDLAGPQTSIAFSSRAGEPWQDHLPLHPLWRKIRAYPHHSATPLLPLVNVGAVAQGAGLWPSIAVDTLETFLPRVALGPCPGFISLTPSVPERGAFLECSLWMATQCAWRGASPELCMETWLKAHYPNVDFCLLHCGIRELRSIIVALSRLSSLPKAPSGTAPEAESYRVLAEGLLGRLNALRCQMGAEELSQCQTPQFADYVCYFVRDAKRLVLHFLQSQQISMANVLTGCDMQESFFTSIGGDSQRGIASGASVDVRACPAPGKAGTQQAAIYQATVCL